MLVHIGAPRAESEGYCYDDITARAYRQRSSYLRCVPLTFAVDAGLKSDPGDAGEHPTSVPLDQLTPDAFQGVRERTSGFCAMPRPNSRVPAVPWAITTRVTDDEP